MSAVKMPSRRLNLNDANDRALYNLHLGYACISAGIPVFVVDQGKRPLISAFNRLDSAISAEERRKIIADDLSKRAEEFEKAHDRKPVVGVDIREKRLVGATLDANVFRRMMNRFAALNPLPAISVAPAGLGVVDIDESKHPGSIERLKSLFDQNDAPVASFPHNPTRSGGMHIFTRLSDPAESNGVKHDSHVWGDFKGKTQVLCPGVILEDGRSYGASEDLARLCDMFRRNAVPPTPSFMLDAVRARSDSPVTSVARERELIKQIDDADPVEPSELFGPPELDGVYDVESLRARKPETLFANPGADMSQNRQSAASVMLAEWPDMPIHHLAAFYHGWPEGAGEYVDKKDGPGQWDNRQCAREYNNAWRRLPSEGAAFEPVEDDEHSAYLANGGTEEGWERWQERLAAQREARLRRAERQRELEAEQPEGDQSASDQSGFLWGTEIARDYAPAPEAIQGLLPASGLVILQGDANTGKTFLALEMLDCVSRGRKFLGRNVVQGGTMLIAGEGRDGLRKRLAAIYRERPFDGRGIAVNFKLPNFGANVKAAAKALEQYIKHYREIQGHDLKLLVLDNLTRLIGGEDMNLAKGVSDMFSSIEALAHKYGLCVVLIHHHNKMGKGAGSYAIRAAADVVLDLSEGKGTVREITGDKMRDGPKGGKLRFRLRTVELGRDQWGETDSSCVVDAYTALEPVDIDGDEDDEVVATLKALDRREDRIACVLDVFEAEATRQRADDESVSAVRRQLELQSGEIERAVNARRKADGLEPLGRSTVRDHINAAVEAGSLDVVGTRARPMYRLR